MNRYLCIHGHFYQPPRENPWSGVIEKQKTADPYHDWNDRITAECYLPNTRTTILNNQDRPIRIVNNYSNMSFNIGPTLLSWMEQFAPDTYHAILEADKEAQTKFSGHGSAIAQVYNHMIMPLANDRDKETQVIWGIKDFERRFNRKPEGMWLAETAVDIKTLEVLAEQNIAFTILAPSQAKKIKMINKKKWTDVSKGTIDTQIPYLCRLPSGKSIVLFFYNGSIANEVAFGKLLKNGINFADRLIEEYPEHQQKPRLVHIANDGETYGHHHEFGNMALAYMFNHVEQNELAKLTIYGEFLAKNPPTHEARIIENTSWSCSHGIERWKDHFGCRLDRKKDWNQKWRKYLRESLDQLRDQLADLFEQSMANYYDDPWAVRNHYISVMLDSSSKNQQLVLWESAVKDLSEDDQQKISALLEMQRYAMLMYTSCGWFFDDISGLETIQILQYAARAMQLAVEAGGENYEDNFLNHLALAKSNIPEMENGKTIYSLTVKSAMTAAGQSNGI